MMNRKGCRVSCVNLN